jgi:hypothetical protein
MTPAEWLAYVDPTSMFRYCEYQFSERKKGPYLVGCCRSIWRYIKQPCVRRSKVCHYSISTNF